MPLSDRLTLGHSGLLVSPMGLGTMTFANQNWGSPDEVSATILDTYVEAGGNFIDTADVYSGGRSEELLGSLLATRKLRDDVVLATKFSFKGGNSRKNMYQAVEGSLRRLHTSYIDLYWLHVWDGVTPAEEVLHSMGDLIRAGRIRYFGLSDTPAWFAARMITLAQTQHVPGPIALQLPYSLVERTIEHEHVPAAREFGVGITPWSPLAAGFLTGKYSRDETGAARVAGGRLDLSNQPFRMFTERNWTILEALRAVSRETATEISQLALAWASAQPGVTSLIVGATKPEQLRSNLESLHVTLTREQLERLGNASGFEPNEFYSLFRRGIFGGTRVKGWNASFG